MLINNIEYYIIENSDIDNELYSNIEKIIFIDLYKYIDNVKIINIIKCFTNNIIKNIKKKYLKCPLIIPINEIPTEYNESNIKYIMEFYQQIYPKLINYHLNLNIKNLYLPNNYITTKLNFNKIKNHNFIDKSTLTDDSVNFLSSNLTMTDWVDEFNDYNPFGFLIKFNISKFGYKGLIDENSTLIKWYPNLVVGSISNNCVSVNDYYQLVLADLDNINENGFEDGQEYKIISQKEFLKLNDFVIIDKINGDTNVVLPIYINKKHWDLTKLFWNYHITFIFNTFEYNYNKKMDNIYFLVLLKNYNIFTDQTKLTYSNIRVFFYYLRTCIELMLQNKYISSVQNDVDRLFNQLTLTKNICSSNSVDLTITENIANTANVSNFDNLRINSINFVIRIIQWIVSSNSNSSQLKLYLKKYINVVIKDYIEENYKLDFWDSLKLKSIDEQTKEIYIIKQEIIQENKSLFELELDLIGLDDTIRSVYKLKGFNQLIKFLDKNNGILPIHSNTFINCDIFKTIYNSRKNIVFNIDNYIQVIDISLYLI
jgi:hypothetical protein